MSLKKIIFCSLIFILPLRIFSSESVELKLFTLAQEIHKKNKFIEQNHIDLGSLLQDLQLRANDDFESLEGKEENFNKIKKWYDLYKDYFCAKDHFTALKQSFLVDFMWQSLLQKRQDLSTTNAQIIFAEFYPKIEKQYKIFKESSTLEDGFTAKEQRKRLYSFYEFFAQTRKLYLQLDKPEVPYLSSYITNYVNHMRVLIGFPYYLIKNKFLIRHTTPHYQTLMNLVAMISNFRSYHTEVLGQSNLVSLSSKEDKNTVHLYLPSHRDHFGDLCLLSALNISDAMIFANTKQVALSMSKRLHSGLARYFSSIDEIIAVGEVKGPQNSSPMEQVFSALEKKVTHNIINYPQGFLPVINEIMPINQNFTEKMLKPLLDKGYKVKVVPVAYEVSSPFLNKRAFQRFEALQAKIMAPIGSDLVSLMTQLELDHFPYFWDLVLRVSWSKQITSFKELSFLELSQRMNEQFQVEGLCHSLDSSLLDL